jgi:hypothetical protein
MRKYHKIQYLFQLYLQILTGVQCGFIVSRGRCSISKGFCPKFYESCRHQWSQPLLLSVPVVLPNLQEKGNKNLVSTLPPHRKIKGC